MNFALNTFFRLQIKRHTNNPMIWLMILIAPVAARFMVPMHSDSYSVLVINHAYPVLTPSVIGLELGIISALLLTPIVYIFLRTTRINRTPWQVEDVTASRRIALHLGHWLADTFIVWSFVLVLAISGIVLSFFRLHFVDINILETAVSCMVVACPAFAFITALRLLFSVRPRLKGAAGDGLFFAIWLTGILMGAFVVQSSADNVPGGFLFDLYGYASPVALAMEQPVENFAVGASPSSEATVFLQLDAWRGVVHDDYLVSRIFWLAIALAMVLTSSLLYQPVIPKAVVSELNRDERKFRILSALITGITHQQRTLLTRFMTFAPLIHSNLRQIFKSGWLMPLLFAAAIAGPLLPFRSITGPLLWLLVLFPYSHHAVRWQNHHLSPFLETLPARKLYSQLQLMAAMVLPLALVCLPVTIGLIFSEGVHYSKLTTLKDIAFILVGVPGITLLLSHLTRSLFAVRLPLLILWYIYFNLS